MAAFFILPTIQYGQHNTFSDNIYRNRHQPLRSQHPNIFSTAIGAIQLLPKISEIIINHY
ncbi:hypothetical protein BHC46_08905 [Snodgrassella alvi]|uniref:Uncharacterized protein n=1 Tax=Snodgrassella alvi TaxID=1196083 RepID=A0A2N9XEG3_9NEIS|nr:hypothetical protein BHC46_08905 [Snodgrassella alvi]PIT52558.1 hypothetical protein BHC48_01995 [Snodgrassella communis]